MLYVKVFLSDFRAECYDYLFEMAVMMKQMGLNPTDKPDLHKQRYTSAVHSIDP